MSQDSSDDAAKTEQSWKEMSTLFKKLESKGLETKECAYDKSRSEFVKGKDLESILVGNMEMVCKEVNRIQGTKIEHGGKNALQLIYEEFNKLGMIRKAIRPEGDKKKIVKRLLPYEDFFTHMVGSCDCGADHDEGKEGHNRMPTRDEIKKFDPHFYYVLHISRSKSMVYLYLVLAIAGVLLSCLLPVWPYEMKVGVWWVSYILLVFMTVLILVRLVVYLFFYIFGYDIWIFPDLQNDKMGVFESFYRVLSVEKRSETVLTILFRLVVAGCIGYLCFQVYMNPNLINDFYDHVKELLTDFWFWGEDKIVNYGNSTAINVKYHHRLDHINSLDD